MFVEIKGPCLYVFPVEIKLVNEITFTTSFVSELDPEKYMTTAENGCMKIQSVSGGDHTMWNSTTQGDVDDDPPDIKPDVKELQLQMMNTMQAKVETVVIAPKVQQVTLTNNLPSVIQSATYPTQVKPTFVTTPVKTSCAPSPLPPIVFIICN
jgi:hypothetical protein